MKRRRPNNKNLNRDIVCFDEPLPRKRPNRQKPSGKDTKEEKAYYEQLAKALYNSMNN